MKDNYYEISLISADLRDEEIYYKIGETLNNLKAIVSNVLESIELKILENHHAIENIKTRAIKCQNHIGNLTGKNKAIQIFSPPKYPASLQYNPYSLISPKPQSFSFNNYKVECSFSKKREILHDKFKLFHVKVKTSSSNDCFLDHGGEGLGEIPQDTEFIGSLLLFNTSQNLYGKYKILDPLNKVSKGKKYDEEDKINLQEAPVTIISRDNLDLIKRESYFYNPNLGEVPEIDVPLALPDLPGIADDMSYTADIGPVIAPSGASIPMTIPELPDIIPLKQSYSSPRNYNSSTPVSSNCDIQFSPNSSSQVSLLSDTSSPVMMQPIPPPPPPPPPPPLISDIDKEASPQCKIPNTDLSHQNMVSATKNQESSPIPTLDNARSDLLAAIRQAGGVKKLKRVEKPETESKKPPDPIKTAPSGDLMADLFNKLSMRRKGISGLKESNTNTNLPFHKSSALEALSQMIPPPSLPMEAQDKDDDWD